MSLPTTANLVNALEAPNKKPILVLKIDGVTNVFGVAEIGHVWRIGDEHTIGEPGLLIGEIIPIENQSPLLSLESLSQSISQQILPDKSQSSNQSALIVMVDVGGEATRLISPGVVVDDILHRDAELWLGFEGTDYPRDYVRFFSGVIQATRSKPGKVDFQLISPDVLKKQKLFEPNKTTISGGITDDAMVISVADGSSFLVPIEGPDGVLDETFIGAALIEDELLTYDSSSLAALGATERGAYGTTAVAHDDGVEVSSVAILEGPTLSLALKLMLSGWGDYFETGIEFTNYGRISATETNAKAIYFEGIDVAQTYGIVTGDYFGTTGSGDALNDRDLERIDEIVATETGSYIVTTGDDFVTEIDTAATISFRSQFDSLPVGLGLKPKHVDVERFVEIQDRFGGGWSQRHIFTDGVDIREFIDKHCLGSVGAFPLIRKGRISCGFHYPPIPTDTLKVLSIANIKNPKKISIGRSTANNFYNTVIVKYDADPLDDSKFREIYITTDLTSQARIPAGVRELTVEAPGLRTDLGGAAQATSLAERLLGRYKFAPETIEGIELLFQEMTTEAGDLVLFDATDLQMSDTTTGERGMASRMFEVVKWELSLKNASVKIELIDTNYGLNARYGLIAPASSVRLGSSATVFVLEPRAGSKYGAAEYRKWKDFMGARIRIRNADFSRVGYATLASYVGNTITVSSPSYAWTPSVDDIVELAPYTMQTNELTKLKYVFLSDGDTDFADGTGPYKIGSV
jgi:hypothetical protein